jgi:hypothetical protein
MMMVYIPNALFDEARSLDGNLTAQSLPREYTPDCNGELSIYHTEERSWANVGVDPGMGFR